MKKNGKAAPPVTGNKEATRRSSSGKILIREMRLSSNAASMSISRMSSSGAPGKPKMAASLKENMWRGSARWKEAALTAALIAEQRVVF